MPEQEIFNLGDYVDILMRRRRTLAIFFIVTVVIVTLGSLIMPHVYRATVVLLIDVESPHVLSTTRDVEVGAGSFSSFHFYREYYESQQAIITSYSIAKQVFDDLNLSRLKEYQDVKEPIKKFLKGVSVEPLKDARLLKLHVDNRDPALAAKIANRIAHVYIQSNLDYISKSELLNLLKNEYLRLEAKLSEYNKIYKDGHPEMIRVKEEMLELAQDIAKAKESSFASVNTEGIQSQHQRALAGLKANNISIIDFAREPVIPLRPNKRLNVLVAMFIGLFGGVGLTFLIEYQDATIKDAEDIEKITTWPFLGAVPKIGGEGKNEFHVQLKPDDHATEAYRSIRTQVFFSDTKEHPLKTIVISSLGPQEGKTTTLCNLGIAIAQNHKRVLLVDADMRKPRLHQIFKRKDSKGLCSFLGGHAGYEEMIQKTDIENLFLVSDKRSCVNSSDLIAGDKMREFISLAKKNFDYILFDSPPVGAITDAAILSPMTDGVILVMESGKTPKRVVRHNYKVLKNSSIRCAGVIVNRVEIGRKEGYYYYRSHSESA
ncbi:MAG: polysaccharide biosynthesis tyrosine autokinase [Candidatus Omnitrophota bacterium]|nr:MAG: polysaccharide biosynthesis tyrosine autokinase [Candidatus Omnitrophota bacterium]